MRMKRSRRSASKLGPPPESDRSAHVSKHRRVSRSITCKISASLAAEDPPASGEFALNVNGGAGCNYVVQVSSNLVDWASIETNTAPFTFVDVNASQFRQRFYRAIYLP